VLAGFFFYNPSHMKSTRNLLLFLLLFCVCAPSQTKPAKSKESAEQRTARYLESIRHDPLKLRAFLYAFPKGGELHHHLSGAVFAESYIEWAGESGLCVNVQTLVISALLGSKSCAEGQRPVKDALVDPVLYRNLIDALSMRNFKAASGHGEYHFFDTFVKFGAVSRDRTGEMIAEVAHRAGAEHTLYLETMVSLERGVVAEIAKKPECASADFENLAARREKLLGCGLREAQIRGEQWLNTAENIAQTKLGCSKLHKQGELPEPGCTVTVRYQCEVARAASPDRVFAQALACFEIANSDPRVVGINFVQPEEWLVPVRDFDLHMRFVGFLHEQYPKVHISLHAGELAFTQVPPELLGSHIPKSIDTAHAERIGHGTDVMFYSRPENLLQEMKQKNIAVEINLTSNEQVLGVSGAQHPFPQYWKAGVPVVLSSDDPGVSRNDLTHEYQRAVEDYGLSYTDIKKLSRNAIEYSFLPSGLKSQEAARLNEWIGRFEQSFGGK
jgi:adenosine deaminase